MTKNKNMEVEIRAKVNNLENFTDKIENLGAKFLKSIYIRDIYFCHKSAKNIKDVEMNEVGSYSLRLRKIKEKRKEKITINTKLITKHGDHNAWEEHEVETDNFDETSRILQLTEFKPFFELEKNRSVYKLKNLEICIEDILGFGGAVEIEIICSKGEEEKAKKKIKEFLSKCNINENEIVPKSITNIIMKKRAFK